MANETTYSLITSLIPEIWEGALDYASRTFVMPGRVQQFSDQRGFTPRNVSAYSESAGVAALTETTDLTPTQFNRALLATLTPSEIGKQILLTDARVETDPENIIADATREIGYTIGKKVELDLLSHVPDLTGGTIGNGSNAFTLDDVFAARALLESEGIAGPFMCVMHPFQWLDVYSSFLDMSKPADLGNIRANTLNSYYLPGIADIEFTVSTLIPRARVYALSDGSASGGTFKLSVQVGVGPVVETASIAYDADAATVSTALIALSNVDSGDITVGGTAGAWTFTVNKYDYERVIRIHTDATTGGSAGANLVLTVSSAKAYSSVRTRETFALDMRRGLRLEPDRDPSYRHTELNATMVYAHGLWRPDRGVIIHRDATTPS